MEDAAVFSVNNKLGIEIAVAVVVISKNCNVNFLKRKFKSRTYSPLRPYYIFKVDKIPRNNTGKTLVYMLKKSFSRIISGIENEKSR